MFSLICARINVWVNIREAGDLWRNRAHYDEIVMLFSELEWGRESQVYYNLIKRCVIMVVFYAAVFAVGW